MSESVNDFEKAYTHYSGDDAVLPANHPYFIHVRQHGGKFEAVASSKENVPLTNVDARPASLEEIMIALERGNAE